MKSRLHTPYDSPSCGTSARRFVSDRDLEELTGVKRRTWQKYRLFDRGPRFYRIHGVVRYDLSEVLKWIEAHAGGGEIVDAAAGAVLSTVR